MGTFYVYEDTATGYGAKIHRGDCSFCRNGQGHRKPTVPKGNSGHRHGPYVTAEDARYAADRLIEDITRHPSMAAVSTCQECRP